MDWMSSGVRGLIASRICFLEKSTQKIQQTPSDRSIQNLQLKSVIINRYVAMVNRTGINQNSDHLDDSSTAIHSLFSRSAVGKCSGQANEPVDVQVQVIANVIDSVLQDMARNGFVQLPSDSEVNQTLREIRIRGRLSAAPWDNQSRLAIKCTVPKLSGKNRVAAAAPPSEKWARLGSQDYKFVGKHNRQQ